jgi:hypothetical protein
MFNKSNITLGIAIVAIVLGVLAMVGGNISQPLGAKANRLPHGYWDTADGYYVDGTAVINGSGQFANTLSTFGSVASSTVQVGAASKAGCLVLGDSASGASVVYITATGATVTASTTKPAACQTAI